MNAHQDPEGDGASVVIERSESWTMLEAVRLTLAEEGIPSVVESATDTRGGWWLTVSAAGRADAERALENRRAMGSMVDWEKVDVGEPPSEVQSVLAGREGLHRLTKIVWIMGLVAGIIVLGLTMLGIVIAVIG